jgi:hypothetical protein
MRFFHNPFKAPGGASGNTSDPEDTLGQAAGPPRPAIRVTRLAVALGAAALLAVGVVATTALAATPTATPKTNYGQVFLGKLATALGVDQTRLVASLKQARKDTLDVQVANGDLTKAQADAAKQRIDSATDAQGGPGLFGGFGRRGGPGGPERGMPGMNLGSPDKAIAAVADKLGLSVADLTTQLKSGKTVTELATAKGVSEQTLRDAAIAAVKPDLDAAVTAGKLTQAQEDQIVQRMEQGPIIGFGFGHGGPRGEGRGRAPAGAPGAASTATPSVPSTATPAAATN